MVSYISNSTLEHIQQLLNLEQEISLRKSGQTENDLLNSNSSRIQDVESSQQKNRKISQKFKPSSKLSSSIKQYSKENKEAKPKQLYTDKDMSISKEISERGYYKGYINKYLMNIRRKSKATSTSNTNTIKIISSYNQYNLNNSGSDFNKVGNTGQSTTNKNSKIKIVRKK